MPNASKRRKLELAGHQPIATPVETPTVNQVMLDAVNGVPKTPEQKAEAILIVLNNLTIHEWRVLVVYMQEVTDRRVGSNIIHLLEKLAQIWGTRRKAGKLADIYFANEKDADIRATICNELRKEPEKGSGLERTRDLFFAITSDQYDWVNYIFDNWNSYSYQGFLVTKQ